MGKKERSIFRYDNLIYVGKQQITNINQSNNSKTDLYEQKKTYLK